MLLRVPCSELALPELGRPQISLSVLIEHGLGLATFSADAAEIAAIDLHRAAVVGLLSSPAFVLASGGSLAALRNLPSSAAEAPQLLGSFHNLGSLGLRHQCSAIWHHVHSLDDGIFNLEGLLQPAFFPPSLRHLQLWSSHFIQSCVWLPSQHLESLELAAPTITLDGGERSQMGGHGCTHLTVQGGSSLTLDVAVLLGPRFGGLRSVALSTETVPGMLLRPLAADEAWVAHDAAQQPAAAGDPDQRCQPLLRRWLRALSPLFLSAGSCLHTFQATSPSMHLQRGNGDLLGVSSLPPHTQGTWDAQATAAGLVARLVYPVPSCHEVLEHHNQLCQLTIVRAD